MRRVVLYIVCLMAVVQVSAKVDSLAVEPHRDALAHWEVGNKAYVDGDYAKAVEEYSAIVEGGDYSESLYYNLANAYFKNGNIGKAILYYNRALNLSPSQEDVRHNLAIAEAQTKDRITAIPEFFLNRWMRIVRNSMSCTAWSLLSIAFFALSLSLLLLFFLARRISTRKVGFYGVLVSAVLFIVVTSFAVSLRNDILTHDEAIVLSSAISVKSSPDRSATDIFVLHEGTKVRIVSSWGDWHEIVIADGKKGWLLKSNVEEI